MPSETNSGYCEHARPRLPGSPNGALSGLIFAVKDVFAIRGVKSCFGNPSWLESHAPAARTARAVEQLLNAGASLSGLTQTDELALSLSGENAHYGTPQNPRAPERVPGGSSSGSAVVVARGDVDFALGTDTGGSVRVPASHCGVLGLRPTHGLISAEGVLPLAPRFDVVGLFARSAKILERAAGALLPDLDTARPRQLLALRDLRPLVEADAWPVFELAAENLARTLDVPLTWLSCPPELPAHADWLSCYLTLQNLQAASLHRSWIEQKKPAFGSLIARRIGWMLGTEASASERAEECRAALDHWLTDLLGSGAWLVLPSAPGAAPLRGLSDDAIEAYTGRALTLASLASLAGLPQLSLPLASLQGNPFGLSLLGPRRADRALLHATESAAPKFYP